MVFNISQRLGDEKAEIVSNIDFQVIEFTHCLDLVLLPEVTAKPA